MKPRTKVGRWNASAAPIDIAALIIGLAQRAPGIPVNLVMILGGALKQVKLPNRLIEVPTAVRIVARRQTSRAVVLSLLIIYISREVS